LQHRLPSMVDTRATSSGLMMYYGPNIAEQYGRAAYYVDRILRGAKPTDLPIQEPRTYDFVVNMKTAQALGITFPNEIMLQVTGVIEGGGAAGSSWWARASPALGCWWGVGGCRGRRRHRQKSTGSGTSGASVSGLPHR